MYTEKMVRGLYDPKRRELVAVYQLFTRPEDEPVRGSCRAVRISEHTMRLTPTQVIHHCQHSIPDYQLPTWCLEEVLRELERCLNE